MRIYCVQLRQPYNTLSEKQRKQFRDVLSLPAGIAPVGTDRLVYVESPLADVSFRLALSVLRFVA